MYSRSARREKPCRSKQGGVCALVVLSERSAQVARRSPVTRSSAAVSSGSTQSCQSARAATGGKRLATRPGCRCDQTAPANSPPRRATSNPSSEIRPALRRRQEPHHLFSPRPRTDVQQHQLQRRPLERSRRDGDRQIHIPVASAWPKEYCILTPRWSKQPCPSGRTSAWQLDREAYGQPL